MQTMNNKLSVQYLCNKPMIVNKIVNENIVKITEHIITLLVSKFPKEIHRSNQDE